MSEFLLNIDYWLLNQINAVFVHPTLDIFFFWLTDLHKIVYFDIIILPLVAFMFIQKYRHEGVSILLVLFLALAVSDYTGGKIKRAVQRERPASNSNITVIKRSDAGNYSFYSNHASNMFTFATYTGQFVPQVKIPLLVLASLVSYSRVYNGVHYPSDVVSGGAVGYGWGLLFSTLMSRLLQIFKNRKKT